MSPAPTYPLPADLEALLLSRGARVEGSRPIEHATQYRVVRDGERLTLNVYKSGKVLVQGKTSALREAVDRWKGGGGSGPRGEAGVRRVPPLDGRPRLGIDEAGKGDYFGPLVVAGVRVMGEAEERGLREAGVRDSKELSDAQVARISSAIYGVVGAENVHAVALAPEEYEARRAAAGNANRLLGELDAGIIARAAAGVEVVVVDEWATAARSYLEASVPEGIKLDVRVRAESDAAVAAASIVARGRYLEELAALSGLIGLPLPKGSTHVIGAGRRVYERDGMEGLRRVAKVHFATTQKVVQK